MNKWLITNREVQLPEPDFVKLQFDAFTFWCHEATKNKNTLEENTWFYNGFILPRQNEPEEFKKLTSLKLCNALYKRYHNEFIHHLKGNFIIIRLNENELSIYSDRFAIKKVFYWEHGNMFIISNDLKFISSNIKVTVSPKSISNYALLYHFTGGKTVYKNISFMQPGEFLTYKNDKIAVKKYWDVYELFEKEKSCISIEDISWSLEQSVKQHLALFDDHSRLSLSLTGGADTRNLLAICLKNNIKPHIYTYGNPLSADCKTARTITDSLKLNHDIHDIQMDVATFTNYAKKIILNGQSLASIHRAHRILAVEQECQYADYMMLGTLGGEFIKGVSEDDYIVPSIVYNNWEAPSLSEEDITHCLESKYINSFNVDIPGIQEFLHSQPFFKKSIPARKYFALTYITTHLHDAQDLNLYAHTMTNIFTPFIDIDYLELLFSSLYTFDNKEKRKNKYLKRIENPVYAASFLKSVYPKLMEYEYCGAHKPSEVLFNKYYAAVIKQIRKKMRPSCPPNFPLAHWMREFVEVNLPQCYDYDVLKKTFNLPGLQDELKQNINMKSESFWLKFTNPIMIKLILDEYGY